MCIIDWFNHKIIRLVSIIKLILHWMFKITLLGHVTSM